MHSPQRRMTHGQGSLAQQMSIGGRSSQHSPDRLGRSPTLEEQKSLNMADSLNMRAIEADGQNLDDANWYELRPDGIQP